MQMTGARAPNHYDVVKTANGLRRPRAELLN
jgi:hypothetical protein